MTLRALADAPFMSAATAIQATLKQAGIEAEIISGSGEQIYGAMRERNFELLVGRGGGGQLPHPDSNLRALVYNPDNSDEAKLTNFQGWRTSFFDPELNTAIDAALVEADPAKQKADYEAIQEQIAEVVPSIQPFSEVLDSVAYRADLAGLRAEPVVGHRPRRHHQGALTLPGAPVGARPSTASGDDAMRLTSAGLLAFARQAGTILVTLLGLLVLTFAIGRLMPVDPVRAIVGEEADPATYQQVYQELGMDKPVYVQFATLCRRHAARRLRHLAPDRAAGGRGHRLGDAGDDRARDLRDPARGRPRHPARGVGGGAEEQADRPYRAGGDAARAFDADLLDRA